MRVHFPSFRLIVVVLSLIVLYSCKKTSSSISDPPNNPPPAITPVGTPVGNPVRKNIGAAGGTLVSPDGKLELNIPTGALSSNTDISIQPVTNEAPGGIGLAYDLLPNGTTFSKPATLKFHYTDDDMMGNDPVFLCIAYQDSSNKWITNLKQQYLDSTSKTFSLDISHFTIYSGIILGIKIEASPRNVKASKTSSLRVYEVIVENEKLSEYSQIADENVSNWKVNNPGGVNSVDGTINGSGSAVTYNAPASIPAKRTVRVSAHIETDRLFYYHGNVVKFPHGFESSTDIILEPNEIKYHVSISYENPNTIGYDQKQIYFDRASFDVICVKENPNHNFVKGSGSNFQNQAPTVAPAVMKYDVGNGQSSTIAWIPDIYGQINVTGVKGVVSDNDSIVFMELIHDHATIPGYTITGGGNTITNPPGTFPGHNGTPSNITFVLKDEEQVQQEGIYGTKLTIIITPIK